jgi:6-phosphogluconolactonase
VAVHPVARFAYATDVGANSLQAFAIANGMLSPVASPVATGQHPFGVAIDPAGNFLFVVNKLDDNIAGFSINQMTGTLTPLSNSTISSGGKQPVGIVIVRPQ